jgi:hypothetical protein
MQSPFSPQVIWSDLNFYHIGKNHYHKGKSLSHEMVRATSPVLSTWLNKLKLNEEKSEHASLTQQNGFGSTFSHNLVRLVNVTAKAEHLLQKHVTSSSLRNGSPNVIWPWSIFYSKNQLLRNESQESLRVFYFSKLINFLGGICQTCQGTTIYGMFRI